MYDVFFVNRRTINWPSEPLMTPAAHAIRGGMRWDDARSEVEFRTRFGQVSSTPHMSM